MDDTAIAHGISTVDLPSWDDKAERREIGAIADLIHALSQSDYDSIGVCLSNSRSILVDAFKSEFSCNHDAAEIIIRRSLDALDRAANSADWRLGFGKTRSDATLPEAAISVITAACKMLRDPFDNMGIRAYRNRNSAFIQALSELAYQAIGEGTTHSAFYDRLGREISRVVLDHKLTGPRPELSVSIGSYEKIVSIAAEQLVYFVGCGEDGPIKIGIAADPKVRIAGLQTAHHEELHLLAIGVGGRAAEMAYHEQFKEHRGCGEWFARTPAILAEIDRLNATRPAVLGRA